MLNKQLFPLLFICIVVSVASITATATNTAAATAADETVTCNTVYDSLEPCLGYVLGGASVPPECCSGLKSLLSAARTRTDRQSACQCVKTVASSATGDQISRAASIPGICKAKVPFKISANVDCSKIK
uniref:Non-specific lipid-transfer protein n=1 Tax=Nicotiana tabacum TaxID=4097 RepID=A0A1S4BTZ5_TOBAC|nr:PREDICTED: non-specific lipid-transfer protein 1-like [Nicotiana tabacum]